MSKIFKYLSRAPIFGLVLFVILTTVTTISAFAEFSFQIIIGIGNVPNISINDLPDYSVLLYTDEPFAAVYIDGKYAGNTDSFGRIVVRFDAEGYHSVWILTSNKYAMYDRIVFYVEKQPKIVYIPSTRLGEVTVFSNVYPVYVYSSKGVLYGVVKKDGEKVLAPVGLQELVFSSPGFEDIRQNLNIQYGKEVPVWLKFSPLPFNLELVVSEKFSPNGDWNEDECVIKIYSSRPASGSIQIINSSGIIVYEKPLKIDAGTTQLKWDGKGYPDGVYTVRVLLSDGLTTIQKEAKTVLDTSVYTYAKEITIAFILLFTGLITYLALTGK
ncbi:hypothetical protein NA23_10290 [Fervidobacterium islandicum]|uniref:FlgD Ig-like domain-containing protein n=1 Tax=Fervidobacterium islandicum TaxID=2423 RepID=A0AAI8CMB1_FERIS|nr:hypothetical protein [Fervidobacterium islandicum]AMW33575.1 hypothetical protein NA23_10290 [Fervidobacterium islandicum]